MCLWVANPLSRGSSSGAHLMLQWTYFAPSSNAHKGVNCREELVFLSHLFLSHLTFICHQRFCFVQRLRHVGQRISETKPPFTNFLDLKYSFSPFFVCFLKLFWEPPNINLGATGYQFLPQNCQCAFSFAKCVWSSMCTRWEGNTLYHYCADMVIE